MTRRDIGTKHFYPPTMFRTITSAGVLGINHDDIWKRASCADMTMGGFFWFIYFFSFFPMSYSLCVILFLCLESWNQHYSDIELGVVGAGTLMIVL